MNRLNPFYMFRGHWRSLSNYRLKQTRPAYLTRFLVIAIPLGAGLAMLFLNGSLTDPGAILAALGLLAGSLLAAFGQLSTWRLRLSEAEGRFPASQRVDRDQMDETAAQLLVASYASAVGALLLVLAMNFPVIETVTATDPAATPAATTTVRISGPWAAAAVAVCTYVVLMFLMALPRLYSAYVTANNVRKELSGFSSGRSADDEKRAA